MKDGRINEIAAAHGMLAQGPLGNVFNFARAIESEVRSEVAGQEPVAWFSGSNVCTAARKREMLANPTWEENAKLYNQPLYAEVRMLTQGELAQLTLDHCESDAAIDAAIQRKFCEVNGLVIGPGKAHDGPGGEITAG